MPPKKINVDLVDLETLVETADFLTLHLAKTPETAGLIGKELLAKAKPNLRIINVARGGIVDEAALAEAARDGLIGGAAVDVFDSEPTTESPLFEVSNIVVTPHLGASTREAQDKAGVTIAEQVALALAGEFVPFAVNVDAAEVSELLRPFGAPRRTPRGDLLRTRRHGPPRSSISSSAATSRRTTRGSSYSQR